MRALASAILLFFLTCLQSLAGSPKPNFLILTYEDVSPHFGYNGVALANTPAVDSLAADGVSFERFMGAAAVCAPNRSALASGIYPTTLGTINMRGAATAPPDLKIFAQYLEDIGYYTVNIGKADYNFSADGRWSNAGYRADWRDREPDQPFCAVYNFVETHQGRVKRDNLYNKAGGSLKDGERADRSKVTVPGWLPDTPVIREYVARNLDNIAFTDKKVQRLLDMLEEEGVADNTIVIFYSDHGDGGLPRAKTYLYDSGLHAPLIIKAPEGMKIAGLNEPGERDDRLISFIDLPVTILNLLGIEKPNIMQGRAFLGEHIEPEREFIVAADDRTNNRYDIVRAVRDKEFKYIRNYRPQLPHLDSVGGITDMPSVLEWQRVAREEPELLPEGSEKFLRDHKPLEELYDLENDPYETINLAEDLRYRDTLAQMRERLDNWIVETRDTGFIPEGMLRTMAKTAGSEWMVAQQVNSLYDSLTASRQALIAAQPEKFPSQIGLLLENENPIAQYWGAIALTESPAMVDQYASLLRGLLDSEWRDIRLAAAIALIKGKQHTDEAVATWKATMAPNPIDWSTVNGMNLASGLPENLREPLNELITRYSQLKYKDSMSPRRYSVQDAKIILGINK